VNVCHLATNLSFPFQGTFLCYISEDHLHHYLAISLVVVCVATEEGFRSPELFGTSIVGFGKHCGTILLTLLPPHYGQQRLELAISAGLKIGFYCKIVDQRCKTHSPKTNPVDVVPGLRQANFLDRI
jgi:hypothetical protein